MNLPTHADLLCTAWAGELLVGVARSVPTLAIAVTFRIWQSMFRITPGRKETPAKYRRVTATLKRAADLTVGRPRKLIRKAPAGTRGPEAFSTTVSIQPHCSCPVLCPRLGRGALFENTSISDLSPLLPSGI
jgi:hypothetical protein